MNYSLTSHNISDESAQFILEIGQHPVNLVSFPTRQRGDVKEKLEALHFN